VAIATVKRNLQKPIATRNWHIAVTEEHDFGDKMEFRVTG
jgi:hypothetical protein